MRAQQFVTAVLEAIAKGVGEDVTISAEAEAELEALVEKFTAPPDLILKVNEEERMVYGWASVISKNGRAVIDRQGDVVEADELKEAVRDFMKHRTGATMHNDDAKGATEIVESIVLTADVQKALGIDLGVEGWFVGAKVLDDDEWEKVKKGDYRGFSIGGSAVREELEVDDERFVVVKGYKALNDGTPSDTCPNCGKKCVGGKCKRCAGKVGKAVRRHPKGSPGGKGGEFAPSNGGAGGKGGDLKVRVPASGGGSAYDVTLRPAKNKTTPKQAKELRAKVKGIRAEHAKARRGYADADKELKAIERELFPDKKPLPAYSTLSAKQKSMLDRRDALVNERKFNKDQMLLARQKFDEVASYYRERSGATGNSNARRQARRNMK